MAFEFEKSFKLLLVHERNLTLHYSILVEVSLERGYRSLSVVGKPAYDDINGLKLGLLLFLLMLKGDLEFSPLRLGDRNRTVDSDIVLGLENFS